MSSQHLFSAPANLTEFLFSPALGEGSLLSQKVGVHQEISSRDPMSIGLQPQPVQVWDHYEDEARPASEQATWPRSLWE